MALDRSQLYFRCPAAFSSRIVIPKRPLAFMPLILPESPARTSAPAISFAPPNTVRYALRTLIEPICGSKDSYALRDANHLAVSESLRIEAPIVD